MTSSVETGWEGTPLLVLPSTGEFDMDQAQAAEVLGFNLEGALPPLILLRTWRYEISKHQSLAAAMGPDQPIYSLATPRGESYDDYPRDAQDWADFGLKRMAPISHRGEYLLGGWSWGGVVALEMAKKLEARGERVRLVVLIDSRVPVRHPKTVEGKRRNAGLWKLSRRINEYVLLETPAERRRYLWVRTKRNFQKLGGKLAKQVKRLFGRDTRRWREKRAQESGETLHSDPRGRATTLLFRTIRMTYVKYRAEESSLPMAQFWTQESLADADKDATLGWAQWMRGPLESVGVPGGHHTMFDAPHVEELAEKLARSLANAGSQGSRPDAADGA